MATNQTDLVQTKAKTLKSLLEVSRKEIEAALPRHMTPDRMLRIAMTEARKNPDLLECTQASFIGAIIQASQLGLEPGAALGHCWLIPFKNKKNNNQKEVQFIIGYRGMIELAGRSERCSHVIARAVYFGDEFSYAYGTEEKLVHLPAEDPKGDAALTHVYAVIFLKSGGKVFDVMSKREVDEVRRRSKAPDFGPWQTDYEAMAKKSVIRRLFKFSPVSIEIQTAVGLDEAGDRGEQDNGSFIEAESKPVQTKTEQLNEKLRVAPKSEEEPGTASEKSNEELFENFQGPAIASPTQEASQEKKAAAAPTQKMSKPDLALAIMEAAAAVGMDMKAIKAYALEKLKKELNELVESEMSQLLGQLREMRKGK